MLFAFFQNDVFSLGKAAENDCFIGGQIVLDLLRITAEGGCFFPIEAQRLFAAFEYGGVKGGIALV